MRPRPDPVRPAPRDRSATLPAALPELLGSALADAALDLPPAASAGLARFLATLLRTTAHLNLTRIRAPEEAVVRHIVEPLAGWYAIRDRLPAGPILEIGSGGGAPGIPISVAAPDRDVILVEARRRAADYLHEAVTTLGLPNVAVLHARAEDLGRSEHRESAAAAIARALAPLPTALELLLPLVRIGGQAIIYAGPAVSQQLPAGRAAAIALGGEGPRLMPVSWPGSQRTLVLCIVDKRSPTPARYPRTARAIRRRPLGSA